jgi:predicted RecB family endonuclease
MQAALLHLTSSNYDLVLTADFDSQVLSGHVDVTSVVQADTASKLVMDVKDLTVSKATTTSGEDLSWEVGVPLVNA